MTVTATTPGPGIVQLTLSDAQRRNPLGLSTLASLRTELAQAVSRGARVVLLAADGPVFSAGADLNDLTGTTDDERYDDAVTALTAEITGAPIPVVAAIDGACIGAAVDLVLACDLLVLARSAYLQIPAARLGILYNPDALARLHRRLPASALRALALGARLDARTCIRMGLAMPAPGPATETAMQTALWIAASVPAAVAATKLLLADLEAGTFDAERWQSVRRDLLGSPERLAALDIARTRLRKG